MAQIPLATQEDLDAITPESLGVIESVVAGANVTVNNTDPRHPVISATGGGGSGGQVNEIAAGIGVTVDPADPATPIIAVDFEVFADVATSGAYADLSGTPTLGTAAAQDSSAFDAAGAASAAQAAAVQRANHTGTQDISTVTGLQAALDGKAGAAQGALADSAVQPGDVGTTTTVTYDNASDARPAGIDVVFWLPTDPTLVDPENATVDDVVLRTTPGVGSVYVHDGSDYLAVGGRLFVGPTEPSGFTPANGDRWADPVEAILYVWWGSEWVPFSGTAPEPTAPGKVGTVVATPGDGEVALSWAAPSTGGLSITDYVIERAPDDEGVPGSWSTVADGTSTATSYVDEGLVNDSTYWYRVSAVNLLGTGTASDAVSATPAAASAVPTVVAYARAALATSSSLSLAFTDEPDGAGEAYSPVEGDIVLIGWTSTTSATWTVPGDWVNPLGGGTLVSPTDGTLVVGIAAHVVTAGEETGGSATFGMSDCFSTTEVGEQIGCVIRNADISTIFDAFATGSNATTTTAQILPGIAGSDLSTGSIVLSVIYSDATALYTEPGPSGWDLVQGSSNTNQGGAMFVLGEFAESGVDLADTPITSTVSDEHVAITVAILAAS